MPRPNVCLVTGFALAWFGALSLQAHGGLHEQIASATERIRQAPRSAALYLARAELYREHGERERALTDYASALALDPSMDAVHLARGRFYLDTHQPRRALTDLDRFIGAHPDRADAYAIRAKAHAALSHGARALADYDRAITGGITPDLVLERARLTRKLHPGEPDRALAGLDQGLTLLGPVPAFVQEAIDIEVAAGRYDAALARLDRDPATATQALWLATRGDILARAGRTADARSAYLRALTSIAGLPPPRQHTRQMIRLRTRLEAAFSDAASATTRMSK
jgi:predicted Zn-dependent protease